MKQQRCIGLDSDNMHSKLHGSYIIPGNTTNQTTLALWLFQWKYYSLCVQAVIGCADMVVPDQAWFARQGDQAKIGCNSPTGEGKSWALVCNGTNWIGDTHSVMACQPGICSSNLLSMFLSCNQRHLQYIQKTN